MSLDAVRVSMIVHALHRNPIVRAAPVADALRRLGFDTEIIGMLPAGESLYAPYANRYAYKTATRIRDLAKLVTGDLVYSFKPVPETLLPAMLATKFGRSKPVLLDVEDDDYGVYGRSIPVRVCKAIRDAGRPPTGHLNPLAHATRYCCESFTVSTSALQSFYGGHRLLHGPDGQIFDPSRSDLNPSLARQRFGLPTDETLVLFAGRASDHKGISEIVESVHGSDSTLVLAGDPNDAFFQSASARLGPRCHLLGMVSNEEMPLLLAAVDIVPVPQHDVPFARTQLPAKLVEAMAMAKSVIVSDVGDLPALVAHDSAEPRGWVVRPGSVDDLTEAIRSIIDAPDAAARRGRLARDFFLQHASVTANAAVLREVFESSPRLRPWLRAAEENVHSVSPGINYPPRQQAG